MRGTPRHAVWQREKHEPRALVAMMASIFESMNRSLAWRAAKVADRRRFAGLFRGLARGRPRRVPRTEAARAAASEFLAGISAGADNGDFFELHGRDAEPPGACKSDFRRWVTALQRRCARFLAHAVSSGRVQFVETLEWGSRGREFESRRPDQCGIPIPALEVEI